jgi:hypothetical protein
MAANRPLSGTGTTMSATAGASRASRAPIANRACDTVSPKTLLSGRAK